MPKKLKPEWLCGDCSNVVKDYLRASNPFNPEDTVIGCPECLAANTLTAVCDEEGCKREPSCGTPTPEGYRRTCSEHQP